MALVGNILPRFGSTGDAKFYQYIIAAVGSSGEAVAGATEAGQARTDSYIDMVLGNTAADSASANQRRTIILVATLGGLAIVGLLLYLRFRS